MTLGVRHTGIVVQDIEKSIFFWTNVLNFRIVSDNLETGNFIEHLLGMPNIKVRTVKMVAADSSMIELLWFPEIQDCESWTGTFTSTGLTHVALNVENISEVIEKTSRLNYKTINNAKKSDKNNVTVAFIAGPEKLLIELVQAEDLIH
jgi:catechol 2,3-dioxygenase-like lactoylglutathione lyase family enzyme